MATNTKQYHHAILRAYIALARSETFVPSELGEAVSISGQFYNGQDLFCSLEQTQINFESCEIIENAVETFWKKDFEESYNAGMFVNPGTLANRIISFEIRKRFNVSGAPHFDANGEINIPRECRFAVPKKQNNLICFFQFYRINYEGIKKVRGESYE